MFSRSVRGTRSFFFKGSALLRTRAPRFPPFPRPRRRRPLSPPPVSALALRNHPAVSIYPVRSILISVVVFGHSVVWWQWVGVLCVFGGLTLSVRAKYVAKKGGVEPRPPAGPPAAGADGAEGAAKDSGGGDRKKEL